MDRENDIFDNIFELGFSHVRDYWDLGHMRLDTIQWHIEHERHSLSKRNVLSILIAWLQARAMEYHFSTMPIKTWCNYVIKSFGCSNGEFWQFWHSSAIPVWKTFRPSTKAPDVRRVMSALFHRIHRDLFPQKPAPAGEKGGSSSPARRCYGGSHWESSDEPRGWRGENRRASRPVTQESLRSLPSTSCDKRELSPGEVTDSDDGYSRSTKPTEIESKSGTTCVCRRCKALDGLNSPSLSNDNPSRDEIPPHRYICNLCGIIGRHYVWRCPKHWDPSKWARAADESPRDHETRTEEQTLECHSVASAQSNGQRPGHTAHHPLGSRPEVSDKSCQTDACFESLRATMMLLNQLNGPREHSLPLSHDAAQTQSDRNDVTNRHDCGGEGAQLEAEKPSCWVQDKHNHAAKTAHLSPRLMSVAQELSLHCADDFLYRLQQAVKRRYRDEAEEELIMWEANPSGKRRKLVGPDDQDSLLDDEASFEVDPASVPCPGCTTASRPPHSEKSPSMMKLSDYIFEQMNENGSSNEISPCVAHASTNEELQQIAPELWEAGIDMQTACMDEVSFPDGGALGRETCS